MNSKSLATKKSQGEPGVYARFPWLFFFDPSIPLLHKFATSVHHKYLSVPYLWWFKIPLSRLRSIEGTMIISFRSSFGYRLSPYSVPPRIPFRFPQSSPPCSTLPSSPIGPPLPAIRRTSPQQHTDVLNWRYQCIFAVALIYVFIIHSPPLQNRVHLPPFSKKNQKFSTLF